MANGNKGPVIVTGTVAVVTKWKTNRQSSELPEERGIKFKHERDGKEYEDWLNVTKGSPWADFYKKGQTYQFEKHWDPSARNGKGGYNYKPHGQAQGQPAQAQSGGQGQGGSYNAWGDDSGYQAEPADDRPQGYGEILKALQWLMKKGKFQQAPLTMLLSKLEGDGQIMSEQARWTYNQMKRVGDLVSNLARIEKNTD